MQRINDFVITVATANGSGSQSSNNVLVRALFRMGISVGGKNLFPSNIQGLPTWFTIRASQQGFTARKKLADVVIAMNPATASEDQKLLKTDGYLFLNSEIKIPDSLLRPDINIVSLPFKDIVAGVTDSTRLKKLLINMTYVGVMAELLKIPDEFMEQVIEHQFKKKPELAETNKAAITAGRHYVLEKMADFEFPFHAQVVEGHNKGRILIDGNSAAALGLTFGGCTFAAWYPITPSSSLIENFQSFAEEFRVHEEKRDFAIVQAEDELASAAMVIGAGWAGARAMTATSGPGLSLMSEAAGLAYYAEIPAVIWDVQRVGPSTGLPTRTMQGDLLSAYYLSHGDTKHVVLLPGTVGECFEFAQIAHDLAERLQTLVIVLSDLDLGMNFYNAQEFSYPTRPMDRGKVLQANDLNKLKEFKRYQDLDGDGIAYRTVTGTEHPLGAYFTRGTGHNESGGYSEKPEDYKNNMLRLSEKFETAKTLVPAPVIDREISNETAKTSETAKTVGLLYFGSSEEAVIEARHSLKAQGILCDTLRLRALPLSLKVEEFLASHKVIFVIEQNRDAQLLSILRAELPQYQAKLRSILHFDGLPLDAESVVNPIQSQLADLKNV